MDKARVDGKDLAGWDSFVDDLLGLNESNFARAVESETDEMLSHGLTPKGDGESLSREQREQIKSHVAAAQEAVGNARRSGESPHGDSEALLSYDHTASAEIALVASGLKPLFHEGWLFSPEQAEMLVADIRSKFPHLQAEVWGEHVAVWDSEAVQAVMVTDSDHYGTDEAAAIQAAIKSDEIGELLGYGARSRETGDTVVTYQVGNSDVTGGFVTNAKDASTFGEARRVALEESFGEAVEMKIAAKRSTSNSLSPVQRLGLVENRLAVVLSQNTEQGRKFAQRASERIARLRSQYAGVPAVKSKAELDQQQRGIVEERRAELEEMLVGQVEYEMHGVHDLDQRIYDHPLFETFFRKRGRQIFGRIKPPGKWRAKQVLKMRDGTLQAIPGDYDGAMDLPRWVFRGGEGSPDLIAQEASLQSLRPPYFTLTPACLSGSNGGLP